MRHSIPPWQSLLLLPLLTAFTPAVGQNSVPVIVRQTDSVYTLSNAYLTATISKVTGDMVSLKYQNVETMGYVSGHHAGYWEQNPSGAARLEAKLSIDPAANGGERGEVSIKGWSDGESLTAHPRRDPAVAVEDSSKQLGGRVAGPPSTSSRPANAGTAVGNRGFARGPGLLLDVEIRYSLGREDHGIYTYAIFTHEPTYGATQLGESRYGFKLNQQVFDWLSVDAQRNLRMPNGRDWDEGIELNMKEARRLTTGVAKGRVEHKYDYCADQFETPAFGWSSTHDHIGLYFINPSMEYLSSGPFHFELTGHLDDGDGGDPTLLDYWRGTHYGGSELPVAANEAWTKVVGPILIYLDSGSTPDQMFAEAKRQAGVEAAKWPYPWVAGVDYPQKAQRAEVKGQIVLKDPQAPGAVLTNLMVGLAYPDDPAASAPVAAEPQSRGLRSPARLTWQNDAKHYEFWVHGTPDGRFTIPNVRPGTYELHAVADGVLGEFSKANVTVDAGGRVDLGSLTWTPVRYGRQMWQIGVPNRSASEFLRGDDHWHWGEYLEYSKLFPHDVDYTVGKSDWRKDWFIYQVPHELEEDGTGRGQGKATTWTIHFNVPAGAAMKGTATLRLALDAVSTRTIDVCVNGQPAGQVSGLVYNATINRDGIEGSWVEKDVRFDASLMKPGENTLALTIPAGGVMSGVSYDVVRLEYAAAP